MSARRYIVLTYEDAQLALQALRFYEDNADGRGGAPTMEAPMKALAEHLDLDSGADIEDIVAKLKGQEICAACSIEGQSATCSALDANKLGRRLNRLLERARGERLPGPGKT